MMKKTVPIISFAIALALLAVAAYAHGVEGIRSVSGPYAFEFIPEPTVPLAGEDVLIELHFEDEATDERLGSVVVNIRILSGENEVFAKESLTSDEGDIEFTYAFAASGAYRIIVELAEVDGRATSETAEFELKAIEGSAGIPGSAMITLLLVVVAAGIAYWLWRKR